MPGRPVLLAPLLMITLLGAQGVLAAQVPPPPKDLHGTFDAGSNTVTLGWTAPMRGAWSYRVYRENTLLATTAETGYVDTQLPSDPMFVYFVTDSLGDDSWSQPAVAAVPRLSCEIVSISTSWDYPYAYAHVHEECLGGLTFDRDVTWTAPH